MRSLLGRLSPAAREAYELQFGSLARRRLEEALATGNIERISDVQRRYCHTTAGYEALYVLGNYYLDDYRFLTAAHCFQALQATGAASRYEPYLSLKLAVCWLRAGEPARAREVLVALQRQSPDARFKLGGRTVELFRRPDDALEWLQRFGGGSRDLRQLPECQLADVSPRSSAAGSRQRRSRSVHATRLAAGGVRELRTGVDTASSAGRVLSSVATGPAFRDAPGR